MNHRMIRSILDALLKYSLSNKDDQVTISHQQDIVFLQEGNDKATIIGGVSSNFEQFLNAEKVTRCQKMKMENRFMIQMELSQHLNLMSSRSRRI